MDNEHEEAPQIFAVERDLDGGWKFRRRDLLVGATLAAAGGALAGCGDNKKSNYASYKTPASPLIPTYLPENRSATCLSAAAHSGAVLKMAVSGDGQTLISAGNDIGVKRWSLPELAWRRTLGSTNYALVTALAANNDGTLFAIAYNNFAVEIWSVDGALQQTINTPDSTTGLLFMGDQIVTGHYGGKVMRWSLTTGQATQTLTSSNSYGTISALAVTPDGSILAAGDDSGGIYLWSLPDGALLKAETTGNCTIRTLAVSADGSLLLSGDNQGFVHLWALPEGKLWVSEASDGGEISFLSTIPAEKKVVAANQRESGTVVVKFWTLPDGKPLDSWEMNFASASVIAISPDGTLLIIGGYDGSLKIWSIETREMLGCGLDPQRAAYGTIDLQVGSTESGETMVLPCGSDLPPGAVCICNCVSASRFGSDCGCVGYVTTETCSCDRVCTCDTVCTCDSEGSSGGGGHYWHPN